MPIISDTQRDAALAAQGAPTRPDNFDMNRGATIVFPAITSTQSTIGHQDPAAPRSTNMPFDLATALKGLHLFGTEDVFWLSADPVITDEELNLRTSCL